MKINLRILCQKDAIAALARDPEISRACDLKAIVFDLDADDPLFDRFLELTRDTSGCWMNPVMAFTPAEMAQARFFQLECRKLVREGPGDYEVNIARLRELPFIETGPFRIKLLDRIALSRASLRPNEVACAGDWTAEFIVSRGVARVFEQAGLTGFSLRPVIAPKSGKELEDVFLLYTGSLLPLAELDLTTPFVPGGGEECQGSYTQLACLTYDFRSAAPPAVDFFRTAEAWSSNHMPFWVISERVREVFVRWKLRGWAFRPVLEKGTDLHAAYTAKWRELMDRISASNRQHHF